MAAEALSQTRFLPRCFVMRALIVRHCAVACALVALSALGCGSAPPPAPVAPKAPAPAPAKPPTGPIHAGMLVGKLLAQVEEGTVGPYLAFSDQHALAFYSPPSDTARRWYAQPLTATGQLDARLVDAAGAPDHPAFALLRAGTADTYVALWVRGSNDTQALEALTLDRYGVARGDVAAVAQSSNSLLWADAIPTTAGMLLLWAEQVGDRAVISSTWLGTDGAIKAAPTVITPSARAWNVTATPQGAALAVVQSNGSETLGRVDLLLLDAKGQLSGPPVHVTDTASAQLDIDVVTAGQAMVLAWTDRRDLDSRVYTAVVDFAGNIKQASHAALPPTSEQALIDLVEPAASAPDRPMLVFDELPSERGRNVSLVTLNARGEAIGAPARLTSVDATGTPTVIEGPTSFVMLTKAPACRIGEVCANPAPVPWYMRVSPTLEVQGGGPVLTDVLKGQAPALVWSPGCTKQSCFALAVGAGERAPLFTVPLPTQVASQHMLPLQPAVAPQPPLFSSARTLESLDVPLSEMAAATVGAHQLVSWVTHFATPDGQLPKETAGKKPTAATLAVRAIGPDGRSPNAANNISVRALSEGGVSIAPGKEGSADACLAWVGLDAGKAQVFLTRLDETGRSKTQKMLTRSRQRTAEPSVVWAGDGWVVAWVDWRDGNGEVYVTKVNQNLQRVLPEKRLTNTPANASETSLTVAGEYVYVGWVEERSEAQAGTADPYVQKLKASDLAPSGEALRLAQSQGTARTLRLATASDQIAAGWIEEQLPGAGTNTSGLRLARIDADAMRLAGNVLKPGGQGDLNASALALRCTQDSCRGVVTITPDGTPRFDAFTWALQGDRVTLRPLAKLGGPGTRDIAPALLGDALYFADATLEGEVRVRRATIQWEKP